MKLMIVDDEKLLRNGFKHMTDWASKGVHIISEAINGQDALNKIEVEMPDVVLTDINMPIMNGIELTKRIKESYPHIIVIVLSGHDDYQYVRESMKYGASDYLLKASVDADEIFQLLDNVTHNSLNEFYDQSHSNTVDIIDFDKSIILVFLELQQYDKLAAYISNIIQKNSDIPLLYLRDFIRDLYFFMQFQMDQLGLLYKDIKEQKMRYSLSIQSIERKEDAIKWVNAFTRELSNHSSSIHHPINMRVKHIKELIESQYDVPELSLAYIADKLYLNKNYLCDLFKAETGSTINQYIANIRIQKAKEFMRNTNMNLNQISTKVGYPDYNYFSRVFRKKMGIPPSKYHQIYL
ncbi:response regulator transcription factor [Vallitalea okinawensis]|uniref:response regulator transcription factor n=1 Tax=Vallitalea okinawensis TaxID=2078660 RepID=UPI000CFDD6EB|nr:response regulator [Vallitalea okinawensis]